MKYRCYCLYFLSSWVNEIPAFSIHAVIMHGVNHILLSNSRRPVLEESTMVYLEHIFQQISQWILWLRDCWCLFSSTFISLSKCHLCFTPSKCLCSFLHFLLHSSYRWLFVFRSMYSHAYMNTHTNERLLFLLYMALFESLDPICLWDNKSITVYSITKGFVPLYTIFLFPKVTQIDKVSFEANTGKYYISVKDINSD